VGRPEDGGRGAIAGINVTPLVDIALVLLVIFIVTAKIVVAPAVPLDLPQARETEDVQVILSVIVPTSGPVLVNGEPAEDEAAFGSAVRSVLEEHPEVRAVVHAEGKTPHERVLEVLDRLKRGGIERVAFAARPIAEAGE
jgi:biopolymer transport protein TolR